MRSTVFWKGGRNMAQQGSLEVYIVRCGLLWTNRRLLLSLPLFPLLMVCLFCVVVAALSASCAEVGPTLFWFGR